MSGQGIKGSATLKKGERLLLELKQVDAVLLSPSLGCPALVRRKDDGTAFLEMVVLSKSTVLTPAQVAFHVRLVPWSEKDRPARYRQRKLKLFDTFFTDVVLPVPPDRMVKVSKCHTWNKNTFGLGDEGWDIKDADFTFKFALSNVFDWVMKEYSLKGYRHLFKVAVNLDYEDVPDHALFNLVWLEKQAVITSRNRPSLSRAIQDYIKSRVDSITHVFKEKGFQYTLRTQLSDYGGIDASSPLNTMVSMYHPVYVSSKKDFTIGHVTDIHLDTRMEIYSQSEASVIEVKENCGANLTFDSKGRITRNKDFHEPIKKKVANFNGFFMDICKNLVNKRADCIVITGDLVEYNRGVHTAQTFSRVPEKPGKTWGSLDNKFSEHQKDRNWLLFYKALLSIYDNQKKPVFTLLGNHDYVKHAMAPWPLGGVMKSPYDMNLTRYECALAFGPGYNKHLNFVKDAIEHIECALWYSFFINPFADYVADLGRQSLFMVDWGCKADIVKSAKNGSGTLHHAIHIFKSKMDYGEMVETDKGEVYKETKSQPFPIRNASIYHAWLKVAHKKTKILFMHPTAVCPKDDVSEWEIENLYTWTSPKLHYGGFDGNRYSFLKDVEHGRLHLVVTGHSHRNMAMEVNCDHPEKVRILSAGETLKTGFRNAKNIVLVSSSAGPYPKYLPGAPLICGCKDPGRYSKGFYFDNKHLYTIDDRHRTVRLPNVPGLGDDKSPKPRCQICKMPGGLMARKPAKRHRPGGNLLAFKNGQVSISTVLVGHSPALPSNPRKAPMCEELGVMTEDMVLEKVKNEKDFHDLYEFKEINIISRSTFPFYNHLVFPSQVSYVTFDMGDLLKLVKNKARDKVHLSLFRADDNPYVLLGKISQAVVKKTYRQLMISSKHEESMAFMRYVFDDNQTWDREIDITKHWLAKRKDDMEKVKAAAKNAAEWAKSVAEGHERKTYHAKYDPFEGMIIVFKKHPDFKKRKNPHVCGY